MVEQQFEQRVERWLSDKVGFPTHVYRSVMAYKFNNMSGLSAWSASHWVSRTGMASSGPAIAYMSGGTMPAYTAGILFAGLFGGHSVVSYLGQRAAGKKTGPNPTTIDAMIRIGDVLSARSTSRLPADAKQATIVGALGLLEVLAREVTCRKKGEIAVCLATYEGNSRAQMKIRARNPGNDRPQNRSFDAKDLLAHRACQAGGRPRIVHDLHGFGNKARKSPTQSSVTYRSFLIIPLMAMRNNEEKVIGFLSIDSTTPYSFFGNRGMDIFVNAQPIVTHIQALL